MASTLFVNGVTLSDAAWFNDENDGLYKGIGLTGFSTIAAATTPDIFATTVSGVINYTGTTTCTGFVAAQSAGQRRTLVCQNAAVFTAGANMLIDGVSSGNNLTCAALDKVYIIAFNTTQFLLSRTPYTTTAASTAVTRNYANNGSFAVNQIVTPTTTDNTYPIDGWRLLLAAANAATFLQDTADVPTGAGYAAKLTVGAGNNNKFGIWCPLEQKDVLAARGGVMSLLVPLKATANLTNTRIAIVQWTSTADAISADPISAWNVAGTNPTLIANWAYANTPASLLVTTAWADYSIANVSISSSATNLAIFIWSDATTTTTTTDILQVGGYVTMANGSTAPTASVASFEQEYTKCRRYYQKSFTLATAPAQSAGVVSAFQYKAKAASDNPNAQWIFSPPMRTTPSVTTFNTSAANANWRNLTAGSDSPLSLDPSTSISEKEVFIAASGSNSTNDLFGIHATADARL